MRLVTWKRISLFILLSLPADQLFSQSAPQAPESPNFVSAQISLQEYGHRQFPWLMKHPDLFTKVSTGPQTIVPISQRQHEPVARMYRMTLPTLDIYSSAGESFYYGDSSDGNVKVIDALPWVTPKPDLDPRYKARPSQREALSMIPAIPRSEWAPSSQIDYTIYAVTLKHTGVDPLQSKDTNSSHAKRNKTIQVQNMNGSGPGIQVIEAPISPDAVQSNALAKQANTLANQAQEEAVQRLKTRLTRSRVRVIEILVTEP